MFSGSREPGEPSAEDHLFDYYFPLDPWESVGSAALLFGAGMLVQAFGILTMAIGVLAAPGAAEGRSIVAAGTIAAGECVLAVLIAALFGIYGVHALLSGVNGVPSQLQQLWPLSLLGLAGLFALAALWWRRLRAAMAACLFLMGSTLAGYFVATYLIAPLFFGTSHDTAPWTEAVVAASTVGAGIAMVFAARDVVRRGEDTAYDRECAAGRGPASAQRPRRPDRKP